MSELNREIVENVFCAADYQIVGKIRTQKIFYLLEQMGMNSGLRFSYHHYGPYSEQLANSLDIATLFDDNWDETSKDNGFGGTFSVYEFNNREYKVDQVGGLNFPAAASAVEKMKSFPSKVIEIAATIHWLKNKEELDNWKVELKRRKTSKADDATIERALKLLADLNLAP